MICNGRLIGADGGVKDDQDRQDHGEHHDVERNELPEASAKQLKIALDGGSGIFFDGIGAIVSVKIKKAEQSAACFFLIRQFFSSFISNSDAENSALPRLQP